MERDCHREEEQDRLSVLDNHPRVVSRRPTDTRPPSRRRFRAQGRLISRARARALLALPDRLSRSALVFDLVLVVRFLMTNQAPS